MWRGVCGEVYEGIKGRLVWKGGLWSVCGFTGT